MKKYSRVSYSVRCQIYAYLQTNLSVSEIASKLGFHKTTIYREIRRNSSQKCYHPVKAQKTADKKALLRGRKSAFKGHRKTFALKKLKQGWSPEMICKRYQLERGISFSHQTIYNYIYQNSDLKQFLRFGNKRGIGRRRQNNIRKENLNSIHDRPLSAKNRSRMGHWERDGMFGANRKQLLVCLERKSRFIKLAKMNTTVASEVSKLTEKTLRKEKVITITNDNGTEFRRPHTCKYPIYYCDALKPQQRGSVENVIGTLRRFIRRTTDLESLSDYKIQQIEDHMNLIPRKMFGYKTPYEVYYKKKVALVV